ncbi:hypothetical protein [Thermomonospora catenispora]|uniref:hypothetical protein n=1 Tax=Thermomonospora catenispora TaxID=2493090 RepID=UPI0011240110|nr:hypothetical protein [Thermomonospora catenispora]TNY35855.1 hypothetical protein EIO00_16340 [Thermomonospora catenispora]
MGKGIEVNRTHIAKHGRDIETNVKPHLSTAREELNSGGTIEGGDFSITCTMAAMTYPTALQFAYEDLNTHLQMLDGLVKGIETTVKNYQSAEEHSTIRRV